MVSDDLRGRGVRDERVLIAMGEVAREEFVDPVDLDRAYSDRPLPIGEGQTISQPYVVALMLEALELQPDDRLLEIGAGCGYAAAVAGRICARVVGVERIAGLARDAETRLRRVGFDNVIVVEGDGTLGWPAEAPYDAILVSAGAPEMPSALVDQLAPGGRIVIPVGRSGFGQQLVRARRVGEGIEYDDLGGVAFVPLIGEQGWAG